MKTIPFIYEEAKNIISKIESGDLKKLQPVDFQIMAAIKNDMEEWFEINDHDLTVLCRIRGKQNGMSVL
jgi:hypothetical protein